MGPKATAHIYPNNNIYILVPCTALKTKATKTEQITRNRSAWKSTTSFSNLPLTLPLADAASSLREERRGEAQGGGGKSRHRTTRPQKERGGGGADGRVSGDGCNSRCDATRNVSGRTQHDTRSEYVLKRGR